MFRKSSGTDLPTVLPNERGFGKSLYEAHQEKMAQQGRRDCLSTASTASARYTACAAARDDTREATHRKLGAGGTSGDRRERQRGSSAPRAHKLYTDKPKLPTGWSATKTKEGETYYINHIDKTTTWDVPVAPDTSNGVGGLPPGKPGHTSRLSTASTASTASITSSSISSSSTSSAASSTSSHRRATSTGVRSKEAGPSSSRRRAAYKSTISVEESTVRGLIAGNPKYPTRSPAQNSTSSSSSSSSNSGATHNSSNNSTTNSSSSNSTGAPNDRTSQTSSSSYTSSGTTNNDASNSSSSVSSISNNSTSNNSMSNSNCNSNSNINMNSNSISNSSRGSHGRSASTNARTKEAAPSKGSRIVEDQPSLGTKESAFTLPDGWGVAVSRGGQRYYVNMIDNTTTWERPRCPALNAAREGASGSTNARSSHSATTSDRDSNTDRRPHANGDERTADKRTGLSPQVKNGETNDATSEEPPRRHPVARVVSGGAVPPSLPARPPALPARPIRDRNTGTYQGGAASSSSGPRAASHNNSSSKSRGDRDISAEERGGAGVLPPSSSAGTDPENHARVSRAVHNIYQSVGSSTARATETSSRDTSARASSQSEVATFNPALFGAPEGTRVPVDLQEELMKNYPKIMQHATAQKERRHGAKPRGTFAKTFVSGANKALNASKLATGLGKGMGKLVKKMGTGQNVNQPPNGYVAMADGGFSNPEGFSANDLKQAMKKTSTYSARGGGKKEKGDTTTKMLNGVISSSLDLAGVGDSCELELKKNKKGERKWKGEIDVNSDSESEEGQDGEGWDMQCEEVEVEEEVNIEVDVDVEMEEEEREEEEQEMEQEGEEEGGEEHEGEEGEGEEEVQEEQQVEEEQVDE